MASPKHTLFSDDQVALAAFAAALAHPARIAIITLLQECGEACCGDIVNALPLAQPTVSQHLKAMDKAGLLKSRQSGPKVYYSLNCENVRSFCHSFQCTLGTKQENPVAENSDACRATQH
ncbi:ArsR/SmtB family transcription factor [Coraliomargarita parva]|uniref:ArsR/SmtB family transcription factor n=1 Tax=Coraliomargarita parva TaxID=3014050 RepID=UPI0022B467C4|nr:metalloregulator ArsR/SmtB family transcription factor [Coraliomargarita parva]